MKNKFVIVFLISAVACNVMHSQADSAYVQIKWYNNLYSQTDIFDGEGGRKSTGARASYLTSILELTLRENDRVNIGFEVYFRSSLIDSSMGSLFNVFRFGNDRVMSRTMLSHLGPRLVYTPDEKQTLILSILFPLDNVAPIAEVPIPSLDQTGYQIWLKYGRNLQLANQWYCFLEADMVYRFDRKGDVPPRDFLLPLKSFVSYYPASLPLGIFASFEFTQTIGSDYANYFQAGGGIKFNPAKNLEIEVSGGKFLLGKNSGAGASLNLGLNWTITN